MNRFFRCIFQFAPAGDRHYMKQSIKIAGMLSLIFLFFGCSLKKEALIAGETMGTTYHIRIVSWFFQSRADLKAKIKTRLNEINRSMSNYMKESEISRFNDFRNLNEKFFISDDFYQVMKVADRVYRLSQGAWDGTVKPLVDLWGFGSAEGEKRIPTEDEIDNRLLDVGFDKIEISDNKYLVKKKRFISLDLSSIAKGYAVDAIAGLIQKKGIKDFLVEIGGEVYASGKKMDGSEWRIGINNPRKDASLDQVYKIVKLSDRAMATSGDYRNFFEIAGRRYAHVLNPKSGYPVENGVASVSILAPTCTFADGLATAVMVLGHERGIQLINRIDGVEGMIVVQKKDGAFIDFFSDRFEMKD